MDANEEEEGGRGHRLSSLHVTKLPIPQTMHHNGAVHPLHFHIQLIQEERQRKYKCVWVLRLSGDRGNKQLFTLLCLRLALQGVNG
jgi:hypothetical protein